MKIGRLTQRLVLLVCLSLMAPPLFAQSESDIVAKNNAQLLDEAAPSLFTKIKAYMGKASAQAELGLAYATGAGVKRDMLKAHEWWERAAAGGDISATYALGLMHAHTGFDGAVQDFGKAAEWFTKAANADYAWAQYSLGYLYEMGKGFAQNDKAAGRWYLRAAEQGIEYAQINVGLMFDQARGTDENISEALKWFRLAAKQGNPVASYLLGRMLEDGRGVSVSLSLAATYYERAAEAGFVEAQARYGDYHFDGLGNMPQRPARAYEWYLKAAEQGSVSAATQLARMYDGGIGVTKNEREASNWSARASRMDYQRPDYRQGLESFDHFLLRRREEARSKTFDKKDEEKK
jgi:uncharacterized protein